MRTIRVHCLGFSFLELLITLSVLSILASVGLPSFTDQIREQRNEQIINRLHVLLQKARHQAITQHQTITLCKSSNFNSCGGNWKDGILIFTDSNRNGVRDNNEVVQLTVNQLYERGNLSWRSFGNKSYLQFLPSGATNYQNGTFTYCDQNNDIKSARGISITVTGRLQKALDRNGDGVRENSSGKPLRC